MTPFYPAANFAALREAAPDKPVRVDANEGWKTKEQALEMIEWLARDGHIQFVEQPMPASAPAKAPTAADALAFATTAHQEEPSEQHRCQEQSASKW
jgi:L-alanine-DL-glutamate epimerase-like enolase superfamily enzyme